MVVNTGKFLFWWPKINTSHGFSFLFEGGKEVIWEGGGSRCGAGEIRSPKEKKDNQLAWNFIVSPTWLSFFLSFFSY